MNPDDTKRAVDYALILAGGLVAVNLLIVLIWGFRRLVLGKPTFAATWSLIDVWGGAHIAIFLLLVLCFVLLTAVLYVYPSVKVERLPEFLNTGLGLRTFVLPATILQNALFFAVPAVVIVGKYGMRLRDIGLPRAPRARDIWAGVLLGILVLALSGLLEAALHALAHQFRHIEWINEAVRYEKENPVAEIVRVLSRQGVTTLGLAVLAIGISAPLGEEMLFRGFLFNALKRRFGLATGMALSAALFTAGHSYALGLLPVFLVGLLLAWVYHTSGSLWTSIFLHATNNTVSVLLAYFFPSSVR